MTAAEPFTVAYAYQVPGPPAREPTYDPATGFPSFVPILLYSDVDAAASWLQRTFGFVERLRARDSEGRTQHCELELNGGVVMLEPGPPSFRPSPPRGKSADFILVSVPDVDAHYARCRSLGVETDSEPTDKPWGLRQFLVHDPEGHTWEFSQFLCHIPVNEWDQGDTRR